MKFSTSLKKIKLNVYSYFKKFTDIKFFEWLTLISALATLAIAIGTYYTIHYINEQNKLSLKPEILINDEKISLYYVKDKLNLIDFASINGDSSLNIIDSTENPAFYPPIKKGFNIKQNNNKFCFKLVNIGMGVAKNISISWSFDTIQYLNLLRKYQNNKANPSLFFDSINISSREIEYFYKKQFYSCSFNNYDDLYKVKFLLPYSNSNQIISIKLPHMYLQCYSMFYYVTSSSFSGQKMQSLDDTTFTKLYLKIKYSNFTNIFIEEKYEVLIEPEMLIYGGKGLGVVGIVRFKPL